MSKKNGIPTKDSLFDLFMTFLYQMLNTNALKWKIDADDLSGAIPLLTAWKTCWAICLNKNTITKVDTQNKNAAKAALESYTRPVIQKNIYLNKNMIASDITACGLAPHSTSKTHAGKPGTVPANGVKHGTGNSVIATYRQTTGEAGTSKRGKPDGVGSIQTAIFVGPVPPVDPEDYPKTVIATKSPYTINFAPAQSGQKAWLVSRWISTDHTPGDWNSPISITIN